MTKTTARIEGGRAVDEGAGGDIGAGGGGEGENLTVITSAATAETAPAALATAWAVTDGANHDSSAASKVVVATPLPRNRRLKGAVAVLVAAVAALGLTVGLVVRGRGRTAPDPTPSPTIVTPEPTPKTDTTTLRSLICAELPASCPDLDSDRTPQGSALAWAEADRDLGARPPWRSLQRYALAALLLGVGSGVGGYADECSWSGVTCVGGRVSEIDLQRGGSAKEGVLVRDAALLGDGLERLTIGWQRGLGGSVPTEFGTLRNLRELYLYYNSLSGSIPAELGGLHNLKILNLRSNRLSREVPEELGQLSLLEYLDLAQNELVGTMPGRVCSLKEENLNHLFSDCSDKFMCDCCTCV